ncbi:hypothetical protein GM415_07810 [Pseudodesulfovibrio cashew]|uniref:Polysaccharide biosynthesis enzyme WcbI domain-containing protein n=1 Tax=Pseudodesulfovibrio cashew TaxID=2678688 RepID=A0A6I6JQZ0_9BACT|nr:WcbI family polysaccharide biosynthesis putative acetyltransferase [Pseudodesulfovibrio cashew]QGY40034.1 hypothetical protein GM415_07810 [Pseudodesulfovibrio cashew]
MDKQLCIVHANCQGPPLLDRLRACPQFDEQYECVLYTNYVREPVPDELLARCDLFLYQFLTPSWGDLASKTLLSKLPDSARSLCVPNMFFKGYWPLWSGAAGFDYRCSHLDEFLAMNLPPRETVMLYLRSDIPRRFDLLDLVSKSIEQERERESHTPIKYLELLLAEYRDQRLFNTVNHPGRLLMDHVASGVLEHLGFDHPGQAAFDAVDDPFADFEQPIHPRIGDYFGWDFATAETEYQIYGRRMTHARYVANYVMCAQAGIPDFVGYLQGAYIELF